MISALLAETFPLSAWAQRDAIQIKSARYRRVPEGQEDEVDWSTDEFAEARLLWQDVPLPHRWPASVQGVSWYALDVEIPKNWKGEVELCLLASKFSTDAFVDGEYRNSFLGGYSPHRIKLRDAGDSTTRVDLLLRVDNRLSESTVPKRKLGWQPFGGLDRELYLVHLPETRPVDLHVQTERLDDSRWRLSLNANVQGVPNQPLNIRVIRKGLELASSRLRPEDWAQGLKTTLELSNPELWSPDSPSLYELELSWGEERLQMPLGFRTLEWIGPRLHVNGAPLFLKGFGQHETPLKADGFLSREQVKADLLMMKEQFGANTLRAGHYPNHPQVYELADELGFLVFTEIPVWQNRGEFLGSEESWELWLEPQLSAMVKELRHHPSIFAWGVLNETWSQPYVVRARKHIEGLDPSRRVAAVLDKTRAMGASRVTNLVARNLHYGWYHSRSVYVLDQGMNANLAAAGEHPMWIAEFGGNARRGKLGGGYDDELRGTEIYLDKMIRYGMQTALLRQEEFAGISIWTLTDFARGRGIQAHGVLDRERRPKLAATILANLMQNGEKILALENRRVLLPGAEVQIRFALCREIPDAEAGTRRIRWRMQQGASPLVQGEQELRWANHRVLPGETWKWSPPAQQAPSLAHLYVELLNEQDERLHSQAIAFELGGNTKPALLRIAPPPGKEAVWVNVNGMSLRCFPKLGLQIPLDAGTHSVSLGEETRSITCSPAQVIDLAWP